MGRDQTNAKEDATVAKILDELPSDELDRFFQDKDFDDLPQTDRGDSNITDADFDEMLTNMLHDE